jgi:flagella basal body P-ring formation protein FlgA
MKALIVALGLLLLVPCAVFALPEPPPTAVIGEAEIRKVVTDYVLRKTEALNAQVTVKRVSFGGQLKLPAGRISYEVVGPERWEGYGNATLSLIIRVDDQVKRNLSVPVEVEALAQMVITARSLERGEVLAAGDLALDRRDLGHLQGGFLTSIDEAVGLRMKNGLRANAPLRKDYLERVPVIKAGQLVNIVVENEVMKITATGRARQSGAVGDLISVQNLSSQKELAGRVVDASTVRVEF